MSVVTMHVCDCCGITLHKGDRFVGVLLRTEKVDQGYWTSADQRSAELCYTCLGSTVESLIARLYPIPVKAMLPNESDAEKRRDRSSTSKESDGHT